MPPQRNEVGFRAGPFTQLIMNLRRPQENLASCCWLARMADKVRASQQENFPVLYRLSLGSPIGIDGYFLRHFRLSFRQFRNDDIETRTDQNLERWFLGHMGVHSSTISSWNDFAPKLCTPGYPVSFVRHFIKWFVYPKSIKDPVISFFAMIE
ncbi:DUF5069 domain-containing protein [Nitrospira sp. T9]|uniref:DUF5069 domain-containing protein n=1 Tax=unclassified Nitrospira TaxID=2652172 RepID=UPI003F9934BE